MKDEKSMELTSGIIEINGEVFFPGYMFDDFKKSVFFSGQDGIRIINLGGPMQIGSHMYAVSLFFRARVLYLLSLCCVDAEIPFIEEPNRKELHDRILEEEGLSPESNFGWGSVLSVYDARGNVSSINVVYAPSFAG